MSIDYGSVAGYGVIFDEDDEIIGKFVEMLSGSDAHKEWKEENQLDEDDEDFVLDEIFCSEHVEIIKGGNFVADYGYQYLFVVPGDTIQELQENIPAYLEEMKKYIPDITEDSLSIVHSTWVG